MSASTLRDEFAMHALPLIALVECIPDDGPGPRASMAAMLVDAKAHSVPYGSPEHLALAAYVLADAAMRVRDLARTL